MDALPWFRYVALDDALSVQERIDEETGTSVVRMSSETLTCLSRADTGDVLPLPDNVITDEIYAAAFAAWKHAQTGLVEMLEAPHSPRIQRLVRTILHDDTLTDRLKVDALDELARRMNLQPHKEPELREQITEGDVRKRISRVHTSMRPFVSKNSLHKIAIMPII